MTKKELIEIIDFLTEACVNKIAYDLGDIAFTPYMAKEEDWEGTLNPSSVEVYNYYERVRSYFINQLLAKDKKEITEDEYQRVIDEYELKFVEKFGKALFLDDDNIKVKELNEQIDILTDEYIKKIIEVGCEDFDMLIADLDDLEDYDEEQQIKIKELYNSPKFKQAKQIFNEYVEKRKPLLLQIVDNVEEEYKIVMEDYNHDFLWKVFFPK